MKRNTISQWTPMTQWTAMAAVAIAAWLTPAAVSADWVDFEDLTLAAESSFNGSDGSGGFTSGGLTFSTTYTDWGGGFTSWEGWAYSNMTDTITPGIANEFSAYTSGGGAGGSATYALVSEGFAAATSLAVPDGMTIQSAQFTNTAYAYHAMAEGDDGGANFVDRPMQNGDWFLMTVTALDAEDNAIPGIDPLEVYLADFRAETSPKYIIDDWTEVDLSSLGGAAKLTFGWDSSVTNEWGSVLPHFAAIDNIVLQPVPEPSALAILASAALGCLFCWRRRRAG